jgi:hypothetical protein
MEKETGNDAMPKKPRLTAEQLRLMEWLKSKKEMREKISEGGMEYEGYELQYKQQLIEALAFWNFFVKNIAGRYTAVFRRKFLALIDPRSNMLLRIIVQVEMLPASVFRKILWKHNIDFMSLESFLRRLTGEQIEAIDQNFTDLFHLGVIPRVFGDRKRKVSAEGLLAEKENKTLRYSRKAAWSYNLLGLDFGFNAYPKGIADDTKIIEISPLRFLSIKNHADDFVVDQEDGKYWRLYRTARSNYVYMPDREVKLNTHICPGFWWTFFVHLFFWILSPALLATFGLVVLKYGLPHTLLGSLGALANVLPGIFTPMWCVLAAIRFASRNLISDGKRKRMKMIADRVWPYFEKGILCALVFCVLAVAGAVAWFLYGFLYPAFGKIGSIGIIAGGLYYLFIQFWCQGEVPWAPTDENFQYWFPMMLLMCSIAAKVIYDYGVPITRWILWLVSYIGEFLESIGPVMTMLLLFPFALTIFAHQVLAVWDQERQEKFFDVVDKLMVRFITPLCLSVMAAIMIFAGFTNIMAAFLLLATFFGISWCSIYLLNPRVSEARSLAGRLNMRVDSPQDRLDFRLLLENKWLRSLSAPERLAAVEKICQIVMYIFPNNKRNIGYRLLLPGATEELVGILDARRRELWMKGRIFNEFFIQELINGKKVDEAYEIADRLCEQYLAEEHVRWEWLKKPFRRIGKAVVSFFKKTAEIAVTFKRLYELFNERCPYITESGAIKTNIDVS